MYVMKHQSDVEFLPLMMCAWTNDLEVQGTIDLYHSLNSQAFIQVYKQNLCAKGTLTHNYNYGCSAGAVHCTERVWVKKCMS